MPGYRFKCKHCGYELLRHLPLEEYERLQASQGGFPCQDGRCGKPRMMAMGSKFRVKDGWTPGWQTDVGKHCATKAEHEAWRKKLGIIEIGYEQIDVRDDLAKVNYWDNDMVKFLVQEANMDLSGREIQAILDGEYFDPSNKEVQDLIDAEGNPDFL